MLREERDRKRERERERERKRDILWKDSYMTPQGVQSSKNP